MCVCVCVCARACVRLHVTIACYHSTTHTPRTLLINFTLLVDYLYNCMYNTKNETKVQKGHSINRILTSQSNSNFCVSKSRKEILSIQGRAR